MSSKRKHSKTDETLSSSDSDDSYDSYHSHKHDKERKSRQRSKKDRKSKHKNRSKSKHKHKHKHDKHSKHHKSKKRKRNHSDNESSSPQKHKKRKLNDNKLSSEMINNAKTVLKMLCDDDTMKQYMINILTKLDENESVCIKNENSMFEKPLKMIFTFLSLNTKDDINFIKSDSTISLLSIFKKELKLNTKSTSKPSIEQQPKQKLIGPQLPSNQSYFDKHHFYS